MISSKNAGKESRIYWCVFDVLQKEKQFTELQIKTEDPDLWDDPENAQRLMRRLSSLREEVESWQGLRQRCNDALELVRLEDESLRPELEAEAGVIEKEVAQREFYAMFSNRYDKGDALLAIHAGAGGTDFAGLG